MLCAFLVLPGIILLCWKEKKLAIPVISDSFSLVPSVPAVDPSGESLIMSPQDYERIKEASRVLTKEEREAQQAVLKAEREATIVRVPFSFPW